MSEEKKHNFSCKVLLVGDKGSGKTTLLQRFIFEKEVKPPSTTGIQSLEKTINLQDVSIKMRVYDIPDNEVQSFINDVDGVLLVCDVSKPSTMDNIKKYLNDISINKDICVVLVGNKVDQRRISFEESSTIARHYGIDYIETSGNTGINISECFSLIANGKDEKFTNTCTGIYKKSNAFKESKSISQQHFFCYDSKSGKYIVLNSDAQRVGEGIMRKEYTNFTPFVMEYQPHFMAYDSQSGMYEICRIALDNSLENKSMGRWEPGWTSFLSYSYFRNQYYFSYNGTSGHSKTFHIDDKMRHVEIKSEEWSTEWTHFIHILYDGLPHYFCYKKRTGEYQFVYQMMDGNWRVIQSGKMMTDLSHFRVMYIENDPSLICYSQTSGLALHYKIEENFSCVDDGILLGTEWTEIQIVNNRHLLCYNSKNGNYSIVDFIHRNGNQVKILQKGNIGPGIDMIMPFNHIYYITVITFNTWYNGAKVVDGIKAIAEIIKKHDPDIVGLQEVEAQQMLELYDLIGRDKYHHSWEIGTFSKFPIVKIHSKKQGIGYGVYGATLKIRDDLKIRFFNSHLEAYPYGPYLLRDGKSVQETVISCLEYQAKDLTKAIQKVIDNPSCDHNLPTILVGDHNIPSHLDFTKETSESKEFSLLRNAKTPCIEWPVSSYLYNCGFEDSYRVVHPNPLSHPGITWTIGYPKGRITDDEVHDRIDFIYYRSGDKIRLKAISSYLIGDVDLPLTYPSDHYAVVSRIAIENINGWKCENFQY